MEYKIENINSEIKLPFELINIYNGSCQFVFQFLNFDEGQTDISIMQGGISGKFGIKYNSNGINCDFHCNITIGNVYKFYQELKKNYENINGVAILQDYSTEKTKLIMQFDAFGHCLMDGFFSNKNDLYNSGVTFKLTCDQSYLKNTIVNFEQFFLELEKMQNSDDFSY